VAGGAHEDSYLFSFSPQLGLLEKLDTTTNDLRSGGRQFEYLTPRAHQEEHVTLLREAEVALCSQAKKLWQTIQITLLQSLARFAYDIIVNSYETNRELKLLSTLELTGYLSFSSSRDTTLTALMRWTVDSGRADHVPTATTSATLRATDVGKPIEDAGPTCEGARSSSCRP
jgi:hypothetical protein